MFARRKGDGVSNYDDIIKVIVSGFTQFSLGDVFDILIIAVLLYKLIIWTKQTRAYQVLKGFGLLFLCYFLSEVFSLNTLSWVLGTVVKSSVLVVVVLFQPELRRAFEHIGRGKIFDKSAWSNVPQEGSNTVREIQRAVLNLSKRRVGALIVIEQRVALGDVLVTGTRINGMITSALIENIFEPNTPLHDGAMIVRGNTIVAAACILPLSDAVDISRELGTRHRAALGVSGVSDSVTIVVSEETGTISVAREGKLVRYLDAKALKDLLDGIYLKQNSSGTLQWLKRKNKAEDKA